jgi:hypothetical protein
MFVVVVVVPQLRYRLMLLCYTVIACMLSAAEGAFLLLCSAVDHRYSCISSSSCSP